MTLFDSGGQGHTLFGDKGMHVEVGCIRIGDVHVYVQCCNLLILWSVY